MTTPLPVAGDCHPALKIPTGATWRYDSRAHSGQCLIARDTLSVAMTLEKYLFAAPDVVEIEAWLREWMKEPTTVEAVAVAAHARWKMTVTVRGYSDSHGTITLTIPARLEATA